MDLNKERLEGTNTFFKWLFLYYIFFKIMAILILGYTGRDDSHTTYFVSDMIASGYGIINFSGENVEQSSSLAFSVILSIPVLFFPQITAADAGPVTSFFLNELFIGFLCLMLLKISQPLWIGLIVGLQAPIIYWSLSGMETSLYLFLLLLYVLFYSNILNAKSLNQLGLFVVAFLLALTRPEGVFIVVCVSLGVTIFKKFKNNELNFSLLAITLGGGACAILARLALGLDFFPNPVYSKQDLSIFERLNSGVVYFAKTFLDHPALSIVAFFSLFYLIVKLFTGEQRLLMLRASLVSLVLSAGFFALLSGGDWMESGRFLVPVFSFAIFGLLIESGRKFRRLIGAGLLVVSFLEFGYTAIQKIWRYSCILQLSVSPNEL